MKATGPRYERETIIRWDEEVDQAEVYTASDVVCRQMRKRGYDPVEDNGRSVVFKIPKTEIRLPVKKRELSEAERAERARRMKAIREKAAS